MLIEDHRIRRDLGSATEPKLVTQVSIYMHPKLGMVLSANTSTVPVALRSFNHFGSEKRENVWAPRVQSTPESTFSEVS